MDNSWTNIREGFIQKSDFFNKKREYIIKKKAREQNIHT